MVAGQAILRWVAALRAHPFTITALTALLFTSAFAIGALNDVGLAFVAVVDKTDLTVLLVFYTAAVALGFHLLRLALHFVREFNTFTILYYDPARTAVTSSPPRFDISAHPTLYFFGANVAVSAAAVVVFSVMWSVIPADLPSRLYLAFTSMLVAAAAAALIATAPISGPERPALRSTLVAMLNGALLLAGLNAGSTWMQYLRTHGPWLEIMDMRGDRSIAAIAMPASEGFLVFIQGDQRTHYIPHTDIRRIQSIVNREESWLPPELRRR
jgi:hypothetical protein